MKENKGSMYGRLSSWCTEHPIKAFFIVVGLFIAICAMLSLIALIGAKNISIPTNEKETLAVSEKYQLTGEWLVESLLEDYGYDVSYVGHNETNGYSGLQETYVEMKSKFTNINDGFYQIGAGWGALYGMWPNENLYQVELSNSYTGKLCDFSIDGNILRSYMSKQINDAQLMVSMTTKCY